MCALMPCSKGLTSFHRFPFPSNDPTTFQGLYNHWYTTKIYAIYIITSHGYFDNEYSIVLYLGSKKNLQLTKKCFSRNVTCDQSQWKVTTIVGKPPFNETQVVYLWNNLDIHLATVYLLQLFSLVQIDMHKNFLFVYRPLFFVSSWAITYSIHLLSFDKKIVHLTSSEHVSNANTKIQYVPIKFFWKNVFQIH